MAEALEIQMFKDFWTQMAEDRRTRLEQEKDFLEKYYWPKEFPILNVKGQPCFEKDVEFKQKRVYRLRIYIGIDYPDSLPDLVVCEFPEPMPDWTGSHTTHTWPPKDGLLRICYYHPLCWTKENKIYEIFKKGREWLKAYEKYLVSGKPMNYYLEEMKPTKEELKREEERQQEAIERMIQNNLFLFQVFQLSSALMLCSLENPGSDISVEVVRDEKGTHVTLTPTLKERTQALTE